MTVRYLPTPNGAVTALAGWANGHKTLQAFSQCKRRKESPVHCSIVLTYMQKVCYYTTLCINKPNAESYRTNKKKRTKYLTILSFANATLNLQGIKGHRCNKMIRCTFMKDNMRQYEKIWGSMRQYEQYEAIWDNTIQYEVIWDNTDNMNFNSTKFELNWCPSQLQIIGVA